jgi:hypothetical protein
MARKRQRKEPARKESPPPKARLFTALSAAHTTDLRQAKAEMSARFLRRPATRALPHMAFRAMAPTAASAVSSNVVAVGVDEKYVDGVPTGVHGITFFVKVKLPKGSVARSELLPASVDGIPTDVEEVGLILPLAGMPNPKARIRPAQPGSSVGFADPAGQFVMAGTFGALVKDAQGQVYILSNNHVLANESGIDANGNTVVGLPVSSPIFQPGLLDGGKVATDKIAELTRWVDVRADQPNNTVDGAIARVLNTADVSKDILFIGPPQGTAVAAKDMIVHKFGRTTSYRAGRISSVLFDVRVPYTVGDVTFTDQMAIRGLNNQPFSASGDSGSAILDRATNKVVGLLFAGATNNSVTFGNHIAAVLAQLKVSFA